MRRIVLFVLFVALWTGGVVVRLADLQLERHEDYSARAARQQQRDVELEPPRGAILDARGRELAVSVAAESAFAAPDQIDDPAAVARRLAGVLEVDRSALEARLGEDRSFVWVARKLGRDEAEAVRQLHLPGIHFLDESRREYPMRELAAQVVGFVGTDHRGLSGLEARYEAEVAGRAGRRTVLKDARRGTVLYPGLAFEAAEPGRDLWLTLDATIQMIVEEELRRTVERFAARRASAVILDPWTGGVLALATVPGFDANHFGDTPPSRWRNAAVSDVYEPGSTFKIVTVAAALEEGVARPDDLVDCQMGSITLAGVPIRDHKPFGLLSVAQILAKSSNVGAIKLGLLVGERALYRAIRSFGFGAPTGIDLPGESAGILRPLEEWQPLSKAYVSFGQEVAVTPLQLARAMAALANGGRLVTPHLVAATARDGRREPVSVPAPSPPFLAPSTLGAMSELLAKVVEDGTARTALGSRAYRFAGKTGTAQLAEDGRYSRSRFVPNFAGFAPIEAPVIAGAVAVDSPAGSIHGGEVAAPAFGAMAEAILLYLGVRPSVPAQLDAQWAASPGGQRPRPGVREPVAGSEMPDLSGLSARQVLRWASRRGLEVRLHGSGWVESQLPLRGEAGVAGPLEVWLSEGST